MTISYNPSGRVDWVTNFQQGRPEGWAAQFYDQEAGGESPKIKWLMNFEAGLRSGLVRGYHETGEIKSEVTYSGGQINGSFFEFYQDGFLKFEETYENGKQVDTRKRYVNGTKKQAPTPFSPVEQQILALLKNASKEIGKTMAEASKSASTSAPPGPVQAATSGPPEIFDSGPDEKPQTAAAPAQEPEIPAPRAEEKPKTAAKPAPEAGTNDKYVSVEANGQGATKIDALNAAWSEAVRLGIGMYLDSTTEIIDENIKEQVVAHSRGRVNSYRELSAEKVDDLWRVTILAEIEKDILKETARVSPGASLEVDGTQLAAVGVTENQKKQSAEELLSAFGSRLKFEEMVSLKIEKPTFKDGKAMVTVSLSLNTQLYQDIVVNDLQKILEQIAIAKTEGLYEPKIFKANKFIAKNQNCQGEGADCEWIFRHYWRLSNGNVPIIIGLDSARFVKFEIDKEKAKLLDEIFKFRLHPKLSLQIYSGQEILEVVEHGMPMIFVYFRDESPQSRILYPAIYVFNSGEMCSKTTLDIPLEISNEELAEMTGIKGSFSLVERY